MLAGAVYRTSNKNNTDWSIFWHDIFNLHVDKVNELPNSKTKKLQNQATENGKSEISDNPNKEASFMDKWRSFMTARKVKYFYKGKNSIVDA